jgi:hypothetical protein
MSSEEPGRPTIATTRRIRRVLEVLGVHGAIVLSHVDGAPLSEAEVTACARVVAELDAEEVRADGVATRSR